MTVPGPRPGTSSRAALLAAVAVVILAAGLILRDYYRAAPEPESPPHRVARGRFLKLLAPVGEVAEAPVELRWTPHPAASMYLVDLQAPDGTLLWEGRVVPPLAGLPAEVSASLRPAVSYLWIVVAMNGSGRRVGVSAPARFQVRSP